MSSLRQSILLTSLLAAGGSFAQTMFIPDTNLRNWLNDRIAGVVDADGNCDTALWNAAPPNTVLLDFTDVPDEDTLDLEGIQHLKIPVLQMGDNEASGITVLWPGYPRLNMELRMAWVPVDQFIGDFLPLPDEVLSFICDRCGMTGIPDCQATNIELYYQDLGGQVFQVPSTVTRLILSHAELTELPVMENVIILSVPNNAITDWSNVPADLAYLTASNNGLTAVPALPAGLVSLDISWNEGLTTLDDLPAGLEVLRATNCSLTSIGSLPSGLEELSVQSNPLTALPSLPSGLTSLVAFTTDITDLPELPATLGVLSVGNNDLTFLPPLPFSLSNLSVAGCTQLMCMPWLPPAITQCVLVSSGVSCIPNQPPNLNVASLGIPLVICDITDPCPTLNPGLLGTSFIDLDSDGVRDGGEPPLPYATLLVSPGDFLGGTGADGRYAFGLDVGSWSVTGLPGLYQTITTAPATADFTAWQQVDSLNDVGYYLEPGIQDLRVDVTPLVSLRPGFDAQVRLTGVNVGTIPVSGSLVYTVDPQIDFMSADPPPDLINGDTYTWLFAGWDIAEQRAVTINLHTPVSTPLGTLVELMAAAEPQASDETPADNVFALTAVVVGSFDPNDKRVEPSVLSPQEVLDGKRVEYTVRFQNTGTLPAERVLITDTLSDDLQVITMVPISASHAYSWYIREGVLHVLFENINLPDSASDEPNSHGFVKFSFVPSSSLMLGASVSNVANIYFDFNEPIITNEAVFTVDATASITRISDDGLRTWPNPAEDVLYVNCGAGRTLEVLDVTGRVVQRDLSTAALHGLDVRSLASGGYTVRVSGIGQRVFVKQ